MGFALPNIDRPFRVTADPALSLDEFWRVSEEHPNLRMERTARGELIVMSPTLGRATTQNAYLIRVLGNWAEQDGRGSYLDSNAGCTLPDESVLSPDAGWISYQRWTPPASSEADTRMPCPEFVIELRSSSDRLQPLREKMEAWIAGGCELAWLIDPSRKAVEIYRPGQSSETQEGHSAVYGEKPVAGFILELARLWS